MANPEHLAILRQGVKVWNAWRRENPDVKPDLVMANLNQICLSWTFVERAFLEGVNLRGTNLSWSRLQAAELQGAGFQGADLTGTDLTGANLTHATLTNAIFTSAILKGTKLTNAYIIRADLTRTDLTRAQLIGTKLTETKLTETKLERADLTGAIIGRTIFADLDLRGVQGLDTLNHHSPSTIGIDTLYRSKGDIPEVFLRGSGVPDSMIEYARSLVTAERPIDYYSVSISYSSRDEALAERLHADLQIRGVRCWYAPHDMQIGEPILSGIDRGIRLHDKLLLILSGSSVESHWVEQEVEMALAKERTERRRVLFPIRIDDAISAQTEGWAALVWSQRHVGDFRQWEQDDAYQQALARLLRDLKAEK